MNQDLQTKARPSVWSYLNALSYLSLVLLAGLVIRHSLQAVLLQGQIATAMDVEGSVDLALAELLEKLSLSLYNGASDRLAQHDLLKSAALQHKQRAHLFTGIFFLVACGWLYFQFYISTKTHDLHRFWRHTLMIALLCLIVGLVAPMMQMTAYKAIPVLGDVVFKYEAKSIYSTVTSLLSHGNFIIAGLISVFSILTPLAKMSVASLYLFNVRQSLHKRAHNLIHLLGKWSMADVFVVAILLSIFALDTQAFTRAEAELGLYFFSAYCLLSMLVTNAVLKENERSVFNSDIRVFYFVSSDFINQPPVACSGD